MYKPQFNKRRPILFRHFIRKGYALFACLGREVIIGVLSVATLQSASAATDDKKSSFEERPDTTRTERVHELDEVEVTGTSAPLALEQAARMVTVLSREEIQSSPAQSINDLLKYAVGVDVRQRGPIGTQTDIAIRGGTSEQITILLNGINICDPQTGHNAFDFPVDVSDIERIEVLEGPAGRVYGTSSLVGAVNIVTKSLTPNPSPSGEGSDYSLCPQSSHCSQNSQCSQNSHLPNYTNAQSFDIRVEGGSFGYLSVGGRASVSRGVWSNLLSGSLTRSDGYLRSASGHLNSDYAGGKAFYQGMYDDDAMRLRWHAGLSTKSFGSNTFYSAKFDEQYERTTKIYTAVYGENKLGWFHFRPSVYWNRNIDRFELIRGSEEKVPFNYHCTDVFGVHLNSYFDWVGGRTAIGAEFRNEDIVSGNLGEPLHSPKHISGTDRDYLYGLNRSNLSFHLEHNVLLDRMTLSAGFVAVKNTWNGMPFTFYPGVDMSYRVGNCWKIYASYNSSLRMPSFTELYYSVGGHKADKYLQPEEMRAVECGVKYTVAGVSAKACVFHHHLRNMIDWVLDPTAAEPVWESVNRTRVNSIGTEIRADFDLRRLLSSQQVLRKFQVAYCYINEDKQPLGQMQTQSKLEYLRHQLTASLQAVFFDRMGMTVKYRLHDRAGTYTTTAGEVLPYQAYGVVDVRLAWDAPRYSVYVEAANLLDKDYVDYGNVPQPGLWLTAGLKWHFR
ncbi:MAG: TonB-dependent receptor [Prevotella sp.]|nr:TonB-dependent receptor [Prevotella sp.]